MNRSRTRILVVLLIAVTTVPGLTVAAGAAGSVSPSMVALGDSYSSGVGTRSYYSGSGACLRSPYAYPVIDAARIAATLAFKACSGATTTTVLDNQLGALAASTTYVTLSAGGNDVGFASVITKCAQPWWAADCNGAVDKAQREIKNVLPGRLDTLYTAVRSHAVNAKVVIVGYPHLFMGADCNAGTWFSPSEETRLNATADLIATTIEGRATAHGFSYVDPRGAFTGHAVCDAVEWVNGLSNPVTESYHPNRAGHVGYANLVDDYLA